MIKSFRHKGLEVFFRTGSKKGIQPHHAAKLQIQLATLDNATGPEDMNAPTWRLHSLTGDLAGHWSIWVNGNWRLTFRFVGKDAELVDYQDYH
jgi:toxin HigB-1